MRLLANAGRKVPRLPLPSLESTVGRAVDHCRSLAPGTPELARLEARAHRFLTGEGPGIHRRLQRLDASAGYKHTSFVDPSWTTMYTEIRTPIANDVNPCFQIVDGPFFDGGNPYESLGVQRSDAIAAEIIAGCRRWQVSMLRGELLSTPFGRGLGGCLYQLERVFATTRVPRPGTDVTLTHQGRPDHVVAMCGGHMFRVSIADPRSGAPLPASHVAAALGEVRNLAADLGANAASSLCYYTSGPREEWASARRDIVRHAGPWAFRDLETALLIVNLDGPSDPRGGTDADVLGYLLNNRGSNRFFDKSVQLTSAEHETAGSLVGVNFEHTWGDGMAVLQAMAPIIDDAREASLLAVSEKFRAPAAVAAPIRPIAPGLPTSVMDDIPRAVAAAIEFHDNVRVEHLTMKGRGAKDIKGLGAPPDSLIQIAYQMAYARAAESQGLGSRFASVYESCNMRDYVRGRTEAIRSLSGPSRAFVELDMSCSGSTFGDARWRSALDAAIAAHRSEVKACKTGTGVDRHLFALKKVALSMGEANGLNSVRGSVSGAAPGALQASEFLNDPLLADALRNVISTSSLSVPQLCKFGFGPVAQDGIGVAYMVDPNESRFAITDLADGGGVQASVFKGCLQESLDRLAQGLAKK